MRTINSRIAFFPLGLALALSPGCGQEPRNPQPAASAVSDKTPTAEATGSLVKGSITADPNPVQVCDGSGLGTTVLSWTSTGGVRSLEVHVGSPNGPLFAASGSSSGPAKTGKWVVNGTTFYLQNTTGGLPLVSANTLSTVAMKVTNAGCR